PARGRKPVLRDELAAVVVKQQYPSERLRICRHRMRSEVAVSRISAIEIFRHTQKTNCGECGLSSCMALSLLFDRTIEVNLHEGTYLLSGGIAEMIKRLIERHS
ncbi:MAG: hypothetical protein JXA30_07985, partial [Deltaproteobacteria bacterium]|nr:hypothetical protein [Deltaproteobacteria bacterium]